MYLVIDKIDKKTVIHKNLHPVDNLTQADVYYLFDADKHVIVFVDSFDEEIQKVENLEVVDLSMRDKYVLGTISESEYRGWLEAQATEKFFQNFQSMLYANHTFTHDNGTTRIYKIGSASYLEWVDQQRLRILGTTESATWPDMQGERHTISNSEFMRFSNEIFDRGKNAKIILDTNLQGIALKTIAELEGLV